LAENVADSKRLLLTLGRGIAVLEEVARSRGLVTAKGLSVALDLNLSTTYQVLRTLQSYEYVHRLRGGGYQLGARVGFLIEHYDVELAAPQVLIDGLDELHQATEETVHISLIEGSAITVVASREGTRRVRVGNIAVGFSGYPHARASGKAVLAAFAPENIEEFFLARRLDQVTEHTIVDWDDLLAELEQTRRRGVAYDLEEYEKGVACIAAVILGERGGPVGAYSASMPIARFPDYHELVAREVARAAENASRELGYRRIQDAS